MNQQRFVAVRDAIIEKRVSLLAILFIALFLMFIYFVYQSLSLDYLPIFSDEYGYYLDAKAFELCSRIGSAITVNEYYSAIGDSSFYGFIYSVFYGTFFKIFSFFGVTPSVMLVNISLLLCFFLLLALSRISSEKRYLIGIVFLSNFIFILYISSSMTEVLHFIFSVLLGYTLFLAYKTEESRYIYGTILLVLILSLFRPTWIFILFGLFPLANSLKGFVGYTLVLLSGLIYVVLVEKYLYAPYPFSFMHVLLSFMQANPFPDALNMLYEHTLSNIDKYFISAEYEKYKFVFYYKYLFVALLLYSAYISIKSRNRSIIAATIIAFVFFFSLLAIYDAYGWREVRVLAVPFMLLVVILILNSYYLPIAAIILFQLFTMGSVLKCKDENDRIRSVTMHSLMEESQPKMHDFMAIKKYLSGIDKKKILILLDRDAIPIGRSPIFFNLPLLVDDKCITYSLIMGSERDFDINSSKSDLFVSSKANRPDSMILVEKNKHFFIYKKIE